MDFELPGVPSQEIVIHELSEFVEYVYRKLDSAANMAREFFVQDEKNQRSLDPYLYPCLVRYYTKLLLTESKQAIQYVVKDLENNGLYLIYQQYHIRILKSNKGDLPPAGPSKVRQWFYGQQKPLWTLQDLTSITMLNSKHRNSLNVILLWDVDVIKKILQLKLAIPKYGDISRAVVHWMCALEIYNSENEKQVSAAYPEDLDDLDIAVDEGDVPSA